MSPPRMSSDEARAISSCFAERTVLVVGDVMLDEYVWGEAARISPEAPVPIVDVEDESLRLGGAANVARSIVSLGGKVELLSLVGADSWADDLRGVLDQDEIPSDGLIEDASRPTTLKTRVVASRQQIVRVDRESRAPLAGTVRQEFLREMRERIARVDGVIISDYGKGVVDLGLMEEVGNATRERDVVVAVDPKESHFYQYRNVSLVTPNVQEASRATRIAIQDETSLEQVGRALLSELGCEGVLITRGPEGMSLYRSDVPTTHIPVMAREVYDVTGAGDTVVATLTLARVAGATLEQAALLSNAAAAVVVGEVGTASVSVDELVAAIEIGFPVGNPS